MDKPRHPLESDSAGRPYMPTPDQFIQSLDEPDRPPDRPVKPRRRRRWGRVVRWVLVLIVLAVVGYAAVIANNVAKISTQPLDLTGLATDTDGRTNILILGQGDPGHAGEKLTDTVMVLSLDTRTKRVAQISLPRDLRVSVPGYGYRKINSAHALGGIPLVAQTVSDTVGIPIHYYMVTNFSGLRSLVDAVGGVDVEVKERLSDPEYPCNDNQYKVCGLDIMPGRQHMDGARALQYSRCRKGTCGNDFGRAQRQQEIVSLVRQKATRWETLANPARLAPLTAALRNGLTTDLGAVQMLQLALYWQEAQQNQPIHLVLHHGNGGYLRSSGTSDLIPADGTFRAIQERVRDIFTIPPQPGDLPN